jgi:phosphoglucosamine mutase
VREQGADLGIAYDGDGDRVLFVDDQGSVVDGDQLLYVIAMHRLRPGAAMPASWARSCRISGWS